jgi:hypothetical protein
MWEAGGFLPYRQGQATTPEEDQRDQWQRMILRHVEDCVAAVPIMQRAAFEVSENWPLVVGSASRILVPPLALLIAGGLLGWVVKGFRVRVPGDCDH